jgi:hypothetical protein
MIALLALGYEYCLFLVWPLSGDGMGSSSEEGGEGGENLE